MSKLLTHAARDWEHQKPWNGAIRIAKLPAVIVFPHGMAALVAPGSRSSEARGLPSLPGNSWCEPWARTRLAAGSLASRLLEQIPVCLNRESIQTDRANLL